MEIILSEGDVRESILRMGREISAFYGSDQVTLVVLANGALIFGADLARAITSPLQWDVLCVRSYSMDKSTGKADIRSNLKLDPRGRRILLADEVLDSGVTLAAVRELFLDAGAKDVRTAVMVEKLRPRPDGLAHADWCGAELPDRYLVGYGLDSHENYRNLPYIAALDRPCSKSG